MRDAVRLDIPSFSRSSRTTSSSLSRTTSSSLLAEAAGEWAEDVDAAEAAAGGASARHAARGILPGLAAAVVLGLLLEGPACCAGRLCRGKLTGSSAPSRPASRARFPALPVVIRNLTKRIW